VKILWTELARQDLRKIITYIAKENPKATRVLLAEIKERVGVLKSNPQIGRSGRVEGTRELVLTGTQYILPYRVKDQQIQILAVFHAARQWPDNFLDKNRNS
jgi:toxin ParE1/3/4